MITYYYTKVLTPDLDYYEAEILKTSFASALNHLRWDEDDELLKVYMDRELNTSEKDELDGIIEEGE